MLKHVESVPGPQILDPESDKKVEALPPDRFTVAELRTGSTLMNLEAAAGILLQKVKPVGYDEAANLFRTEYEMTTAAQCVWLLAEAEVAGRLEDLKRDFPEVLPRAQRIIAEMIQNDAPGLVEIYRRLQQPDYSVDQVRGIQANATELAKILLRKE